MSIKSTYVIKRDIAISIVHFKLGECSNEQLENILLEFDESAYRNYVISEDDYNNPIINSIDDFNKKGVV